MGEVVKAHVLGPIAMRRRHAQIGGRVLRVPANAPSYLQTSAQMNQSTSHREYPIDMGEAGYMKYTLGFIVSESNEVLMLNRQKAPWMGRWNGVGGKLDPHETPYQCIVRETYEETGLHVPQYQDRGTMRWMRNGSDLGGVHIFSAEVLKAEMDSYKTPRCHCHEGILDWKHMDWLLHPENTGIVDNVKIMFQDLFRAGPLSSWVSAYENSTLVSCDFTPGLPP